MAAKLKDGLFLGDFETAQDMEFIMANKITRIINCAGREVGNMWDRSGVKYLTYFWPETGNCVIFDESNAVLDEIYGTIEEALEAHEAVLIHSIDGASRACFCAAVYFILKYRWCVVLCAWARVLLACAMRANAALPRPCTEPRGRATLGCWRQGRAGRRCDGLCSQDARQDHGVLPQQAARFGAKAGLHAAATRAGPVPATPDACVGQGSRRPAAAPLQHVGHVCASYVSRARGGNPVAAPPAF